MPRSLGLSLIKKQPTIHKYKSRLATKTIFSVTAARHASSRVPEATNAKQPERGHRDVGHGGPATVGVGADAALSWLARLAPALRSRSERRLRSIAEANMHTAIVAPVKHPDPLPAGLMRSFFFLIYPSERGCSRFATFFGSCLLACSGLFFRGGCHGGNVCSVRGQQMPSLAWPLSPGIH